MKHDCDIVRDLMPMCIDGTASEKAKQMVDEHVAECPPCDKVYAEMKGEAKLELPVQPAAPEFVTTVKKMKNRRKRRTWLTLLMGVVIAAVVALAGFGAYFFYFVNETLMDDAQLSLVTTKDGMALIHASNVPKSASMTLQLSEMVYPESAKGQYEVHAYVYATRYAARSEGDDVYFIIGNVKDNKILMENSRIGEGQAYRMLIGRSDGSGQVFYLADEEMPQQVSIKGAHLKSPETVTFAAGSLNMVPFITPMSTHTPTPDSSQDFVINSPTTTPVPISVSQQWQPGQITTTPMSTPTPRVGFGTEGSD